MSFKSFEYQGSNPLPVFDLLGSPANRKHATQVTQASQATHTAQPPCFPLILFSKDNTPVARKKLVVQCSAPSCLIPQQFHYPRPVNRGRPGEANFLLLKTLIGRYRRPTTLLAKGFVLSHCKRLPQLYEQPAPCVPRQIVPSDRLHLFSLSPTRPASNFLSHTLNCHCTTILSDNFR